MAKSLIISFQYNIESVYFFYSNPVFSHSFAVSSSSIVATRYVTINTQFLWQNVAESACTFAHGATWLEIYADGVTFAKRIIMRVAFL